MKKVILSLITSVCVLVTIAGAQSDPDPFNLGDQGKFAFTSWPADAPGGTYPSNIIFHIMGPEAPITLNSVATADVTGPYNLTTGSRINGLDENGISIMNMTKNTADGFETNQNGEIVLALNTVGRSHISLDFTAGTIERGTPSAESRIRVQYRVKEKETWSGWQEIQGKPLEYISSMIIPSEKVYTRILLPEEANNRENVQIRWLFYHSEGILDDIYRSPVIRIDDILVITSPIVSMDPVMACSSDNAVPLTASPEGGTFSGDFVSGNTFNAQAAGPGIHEVTYTFTDNNGFSNSVTAEVNVGAINCTTSLTDEFCGMTEMTLDQNIFVNPIAGAADYEFEFSDPGSGFTQTARRGNPNPVIYLGAVPGLKYGSTYDIRVRFRMENQWSPYGPVCQISLQEDIPLTKLSEVSCGAENLDLSETIHAIRVAGAVNYEFRFINNSLNFSVVKSRGNANPLLPLSSVKGLRYGTSYHVQVRSLVGGNWSDFGDICVISISPDVPSPMLTPVSCGATNLDLNATIFSEKIPGATDYEFRFTNRTMNFSTSQARGNSNPLLWLGSVNGLKYGKSYMVEVRAFVGGVWTPYGESCQITLQDNIPLTQLRDDFCGATVTTEETIFADKIAGAVNYNFLFLDPTCFDSISVNRGNSNPLIPLYEVEGLVPGKMYHVQVRANVAGDWAKYGPVCTLVITGTRSMENLTTSNTNNNLNYNIFPNPTKGNFTISNQEKNYLKVSVFNATGQQIRTENSSNGQISFNMTEVPRGIYIIRIESPGATTYERIILSD